MSILNGKTTKKSLSMPTSIKLLMSDPRDPLLKTAGMFLISAWEFAAPKTTTSFEAACKIQDEQKIHPLLFQVHTHKLGMTKTEERTTFSV